MKTYRVGIIGLGRISPMHLQAFENISSIQFVACCDIDCLKMDDVSNKYHVARYTDYKEMILNENLDVVHICLPHYLHYEVCKFALEHNVNVICEKPLTINYDESVELYKIAENKGLHLGTIFQCRYNQASQVARQTLESGKLGKIINVKSYLTWCRNDSYYSDDWHGKWETEGGGVIINQTIHSVDLVNWLVDSKVIDVKCMMHNFNHPVVEVEDTATGVIKYENGVTYLFYASLNYYKNAPIEILISCEKGTINLTYTEIIITYDDGKQEHYSNKDNNFVNVPYWCDSHTTEIRNFFNSLDNTEEFLINKESVLKTQKLICDIYNEGKKTL